jgi:cell division protein FtsQ
VSRRAADRRAGEARGTLRGGAALVLAGRRGGRHRVEHGELIDRGYDPSSGRCALGADIRRIRRSRGTYGYKEEKGARGRQSGLAGLVLFALLALVVGVLINSQVFIVRNIEVNHVETVAPNDVIRKAGLSLGLGIFSVDENRVRAAFEREGLIAFDGLERRLPDTIRLNVHERVRRAVVNYLGVALIIDNEGIVVEQLGEMPDYGLTVVTGVRATSYQVGRRLTSDVPLQVGILLKVLDAIRAQQLEDRISELIVADLDNMYMMEKGGMMVKIGDETNLTDKLLWMRSELNQQLYPQGTTRGTLDVSSGTSAVYVEG